MSSTDDIARSRRSPPEVNCSGKVGFSAFTQANTVIKRTQTKARPGRSIYRCGHCGQWHIGVDVGRIEKRKAADFKERKHGNV